MPATKQAKRAPPPGTKPLPGTPTPAGRDFAGLARQLRKWLILRVEKIVLGGCIIGALVFCGLGFQRLPYGKSPADLKAEADKALKDVEAAKPPAKVVKDLSKGPDIKSLQSAVSKEIDRRAYAMTPLRVPVENRYLRRREPRVLPVQRLLVSAGHGPIAIKGAVVSTPKPSPPPRPAEEKPLDERQRYLMQRKKEAEEKRKQFEEKAKAKGRPPKAPKETKPVEEPVVVKVEPKEKPLLGQAPAGSHLEERSWVCLVGVIPYVRQIEEYHRAFEDALFHSPDRDVPHYGLPQIERAEIVGGRRMPWRPVHVISALVDHTNWALDYPEALDPRLVDPDLTEPLPPLVLANYDNSAVNHPQVKVAVIRKPKPAAQAELTGEGKPGQEGAAQAGGEKKPAPPIFGLRDKKASAPAESASKPPDDKNAAPAAPAKSKEEPPEERVVSRLFRFFDFHVEPGKAYCYRVKLVAINPNYELPQRLLARSNFAKELFVEARWSQPSPPVAVVRGTRLLASGIEYAESESSFPEPMAKILVRFFDFPTSMQAFALFDAARGTVLNQAGVRVPQPEAEPPPEKRPGKPEKAPEAPTVDVRTDAVVLDLFGGDALAGRSDRKVPSHVLVLDRFGGFKTLSQANDAYTFEADLPAAQAASVAATTKPVSEQARK